MRYATLLRSPVPSENGVRHPRRRAAAAVLVMVSMPALVGMAALTVDVGYLYQARQQMQIAADAAAMAAAWTFVDEDGNVTIDVARAQAAAFATMNSNGAVTTVEAGWIQDPADPASPFIPTVFPPINAFRVTSERTAEAGNALPLFFAGVFGITETDVSASAVAALTPVQALDGVPVALRVPGFGPVDPDIVLANPGKDGPSEPLDGVAFQIGEQVTLFTFGKGPKSPVHLVLNTNDIPGEAQLGKVLRGEDPPVPLALGDVIDVMGEGTGHNGLGAKLADRLDDGDPSNDVVLVPVVATLPDSRDAQGDLSGNVVIVDFVAVRLDAVIAATVPDPNDPQNTGKTIDIELLVGTIIQRPVSGTATMVASGVVDGPSVAVPQIIR